MSVEIGNLVRLINPKSVKHFEIGNMSTEGVIVKIDYNNYVGHHHRPYFIKFDGQLGEWSYALLEFEVIHCVECSKILTDRMPKGWTEKGVCSGRCWSYLYGEYD